MYQFNNKMLIASICVCSVPYSYADQNHVSIDIVGDKRCITSNGLPDHSTGKFPNSGNPNRISSQSIKLCVSTNPVKGAVAQPARGSVGVALNGVQMRPGTADYYDPSSQRGFSRDRSSGWNLEGLGARTLLGMDNNNAHVDNRGLYHYHGVAPVVAKNLKDNLIGYAADGFPIYYLPQQYRSSHQLKQGVRPSGPGGKYDGTYNEDWQYVKGSGNLDQCNGTYINGKYSYFATDNYPFFPRCLYGKISNDFVNERGQQERGNHSKAIRKGARKAPAEALRACRSKSTGDFCAFNPPHSNRSLKGKCQTTPANQLACRPKR